MGSVHVTKGELNSYRCTYTRNNKEKTSKEEWDNARGIKGDER